MCSGHFLAYRIREYKLRRNRNRPDRHTRMPELEPSPEVSDADLSISRMLALKSLHFKLFTLQKCGIF